MIQNLVRAYLLNPSEVQETAAKLMGKGYRLLSIVRVTPFQNDMTPHPRADYMFLIEKDRKT